MTTNRINEELKKLTGDDLCKNINYLKDAIIIKSLPSQGKLNLVLFVIDKGQGLFEHSAAINVMVYIIEGEIEFTVAGKKHNLTNDGVIEIPADTPHNFRAIDQTKMIIIIL